MGNKIVAARELAPQTMLFEIEAEHIAQRDRAGQFVILRVCEEGERIPLTIANRDVARGVITIVAQEVGKTTCLLNRMQVGDEILDLAGPLGQPTNIPAGERTVVCVGGGIGNAVVWPQVAALKEAGNEVISILGARTKELLILEDEITALSDRAKFCWLTLQFLHRSLCRVLSELARNLGQGILLTYCVVLNLKK